MILSIIFAASEAAHGAGSAGISIDWGRVFEFARNGASVAAILTGMFFVLAGTFGVLRLPDFFTRLHAAGMTDTLGAELVILGLIIQAGFSLLTLKLLLVSLFLFVTSPTATHAVANAAYHAGLKPLLGKYRAPNPSEETPS